MKEKPLPEKKRVTEKQLSYLKSLMIKRDFSFINKYLSKEEASFMIKTLLSQSPKLKDINKFEKTLYR